VVAALSHLGEKAGIRGSLAHVKAVKALLESNNKQLDGRVGKLKRVLANFWGEANRMVAIDSGTTNIVLARKFLAELRIPMAGSPLCALTVCTNSRRIFEVLGQSTVPVKTIIIGGQQKFRSPTICGAMAELFLKAVSLLQFGMCILGATRLDLDRFAVCSDSQEESSIKTLLMERSSLRVIAVDHNKLQAGLGRTGYKFASIDPEHIDLIVTNSPLMTDPPAVFTDFIRFVKAIKSRGVPVLVATSDQTHPYPAAEIV
jgi:DeoR/GlpR family transcriptional regulator of sugar metabolism